MANLKTEVLRARIEIGRAALERWTKHAASREISNERIRRLGPGAGDSDERRAQFAVREALRFTERKIGATFDATVFAPSERARDVARPVARLVTLPGDGFQPQGFATGFLVSPNLLLTNHHVFPNPRAAMGKGANFLYEESEKGINLGTYFELQPQRFYLADDFLDFALVAVNPVGRGRENLRDYGYIRLIEATGKILKGYPVNMIEHPDGGPRQYSIKNNSLLDVLDEGFLQYETDTLAGSSGAPAFNEQWELVAVHHCGIPTIVNGVPIKEDGTPWDRENDPEDTIKWLANEGTRVSFIVNHLKDAVAAGDEPGLLDELRSLVVGPPAAGTSDTTTAAVLTRTAPEARIQAPPPHTPETAMCSTIINITGPVTIHIGAPAGSVSIPGQGVLSSVPETVKALEIKQVFDPRYAKRGGYDPSFLGVEIPPPTVNGDRFHELYNVGDYKNHARTSRLVPRIDTTGLADAGVFVLHYYHYSIAFNREYRMAAWTASNADYRSVMRQDPRARAAFGGEDWKPDPRVPDAFQLLDKDIYKPAQNFDRGHLVRREDNCWGAAGEETGFANADSYHWTNCTPQHELFNQTNPKGPEYRGRVGIWGLFEGDLQKELEHGGGQATIFSGPVLNAEIPEKDFGTGTVRYPTHFWKVVVIADESRGGLVLKAYGFVFDQSDSIAEFGIGFEESLELPSFERTKIQEIEELAGLTFDQAVRDADQFGVPI